MSLQTPSEEVEAMGSMKEVKMISLSVYTSLYSCLTLSPQPANPGKGIGRLRSLFGGLKGAKSGDTGYPEEEEVEDNVKVSR